MAAYRHCISENSAQRQCQFEDALLAIMAAKPFQQISIQEICDQVGLSRKSFYRYFSGKEACLCALVDHTILGFTEFSYREEDRQKMLEDFFTYWRQNKPLLDVLARNDLSALLYERANYCTSQEYGGQVPFFRENGTYEQTVFFVSGMFGVLQNWHQEGCQKSPAQLASALGSALSQRSRSVF